MNIAAQAYEIFTSHLLSEICDESKNLCRENDPPAATRLS